MEKDKVNPLGTEPVGRLLRKFAIPSIISMLVTSLYNIVDQFFIGRTVGELGNAATNIAFPLTTMCLAAMLALGIGGAAGFNLNMGAGNKKKAMYFIGNALTVMFGVGVVIALISLFFMEPLLKFFNQFTCVSRNPERHHIHNYNDGNTKCKHQIRLETSEKLRHRSN